MYLVLYDYDPSPTVLRFDNLTNALECAAERVRVYGEAWLYKQNDNCDYELMLYMTNRG